MKRFLAIVTLSIALMACGETNVEFVQQMNYTTTLSLTGDDGGTISPSDQTILLRSGVDFMLAEQTPELASHRGRFEALQIQQVTYAIKSNSISADIGALEIAVGPLGVDDPSAPDAVLIATIPQIAARGGGEGAAEVHHENSVPAEAHVFPLDFGIAQGAEFQVAAGSEVPQGSITLDIEMFLTLVAQ